MGSACRDIGHIRTVTGSRARGQGESYLGVVLCGNNIYCWIGRWHSRTVAINCLEGCVEKSAQPVGPLQSPYIRTACSCRGCVINRPISCYQVGWRNMKSEIVNPVRGKVLILKPVIIWIDIIVNQVGEINICWRIAGNINDNILKTGRVCYRVIGIGGHADSNGRFKFHGGNP